MAEPLLLVNHRPDGSVLTETITDPWLAYERGQEAGRAALAAVLALHTPGPVREHPSGDYRVCDHDGDYWPCLTFRACTGASNG